MTLPIVFHPDYTAPLRPGHAFPMSKYGYLREALVARRLLPPAGGFLSPAPASVSRVAAVHALPYVERVANQTLTPAEERAIGLPNTAAVARPDEVDRRRGAALRGDHRAQILADLAGVLEQRIVRIAHRQPVRG